MRIALSAATARLSPIGPSSTPSHRVGPGSRRGVAAPTGEAIRIRATGKVHVRKPFEMKTRCR